MKIQLCRNCLHQLYSSNRILCPVCNDLTIPCSENLVGVVTRLIARGIEVVSASCDVYDDITGSRHIGTTVQIQIELGCLYPSAMFDHLPPTWATYVYHAIVDNQIGPAYTGLCHIDSFLKSDTGECEFATALTISNLELWIDSTDAASFYSVWRLAGVIS